MHSKILIFSEFQLLLFISFGYQEGWEFSDWNQEINPSDPAASSKRGKRLWSVREMAKVPSFSFPNFGACFPVGGTLQGASWEDEGNSSIGGICDRSQDGRFLYSKNKTKKDEQKDNTE